MTDTMQALTFDRSREEWAELRLCVHALWRVA